MRTENYTHRGYEIQITHNPPIWQAAIYASKPNMPAVDWTHEPISATSVYPPLAEAKRRIDAILSDLPPSTDDKQALT
jgi:hypothetical protein